jgi:hypothetical protein
VDKLIASADPLLSLAGVLFAIGLAFDAIFSNEFKDRIKQTIIQSYLRNLRLSLLLAEYSRFFVIEILSIKKVSAYLLKTATLSIVFYLIVAVFEARSSSGIVQANVLESVASLTPSIIFLFFSQILFDVFSSYVSVIYIRMIARNRHLGQIIILLISDVVVSACLWGIFFSYAIAFHLKIADLSARQINLAVSINRDLNGPKAADVFENPGLKGGILVAYLSTYNSDEQKFYGREKAKSREVVAFSDIGDDKLVFKKFLDVIANLREPGVQTSLSINVAQEQYYAHMAIANVLDRADFDLVFGASARLLNPLVLYFDQFGTHYFAVRQLYSWIIQDYDDHLRFGDLAVFCNDQFLLMTASEARTYDFTRCETYFITPKKTSRFIALWGGFAFPTNYLFSPAAFFWSSMALTASYYLVLVVMISIKLMRNFVSWNMANNILNVDRGFFTAIFAIPSTALLLAYALKVVMRSVL